MGVEERFNALGQLVWLALLAALTAVGAYVVFPIGPLPFSLQPFFVLLAGFVLGPVRGAACMLLYLLVGFIGLPVFAGGSGGLAHIFGPTGGFMIGFVPCACVAGLARARSGKAFSFWAGVVWGLAGLVMLYALGVGRLKWALGIDWAKALAVGFLPFIPGDLIKLAMASATRKYLGRTGVLPP